MAEVITPEKVLAYGRRIRELVFETGTPEERLAGLRPDEILSVLTPEEILAGLNREKRQALLRRLQDEMGSDADSVDDTSQNI